LSEVGELLGASDGDGGVSERLRDIAHRKLPEVKSLIERARLVREWLEAAADCRCPTLDECPLFDDPGTQTTGGRSTAQSDSVSPFQRRRR
jgi:hypothetical protein